MDVYEEKLLSATAGADCSYSPSDEKIKLGFG